VTTQAACQTACLAKTYGQCGAYDFDTSTNKCLLFQVEPVSLNDKTGTNHYTRKKCAACTDTFGISTNKHGINGAEQSGVTTVSSCNSVCLAKAFAQCGAYDFDTQSNKCYLFQVEPVSLNDKTGTNHYTRKACTTTGTCTDTFKASANKQGINGAEQSGITTIAACNAACLAKKFTECGAYDFDTTSNKCYLFQVEPVSLNDKAGTTHYMREDCTKKACEPYKFGTAQVGTQVYNGKQITTATTSAMCEAECLKAAKANPDDCVAYSMATVGGCFLILKSSAPTVTGQGSGITTYYRQDNTGCVTPPPTSKCDGKRKYTYQTLVNKVTQSSSNPGTSENLETAELCKDKCDNADTCVSIMYNRQFKVCTWFTVQPTLTEDKNGHSDYYIKLKKCENVCTDTFDMTAKKKSINGAEQAGVTTQENCQKACLAKKLTECGAYDFDTVTKKCVLFQVAPTTLSDSANNNHYKRKACSTTCVDTFDETSNKNAINGAEQAGITSLDACQKACLAKKLTECGAFDYDTSAKKCLIFQTAPSVLNDKSGTNHYKRKACTPGTCIDSYTEKADTHSNGGTSDQTATTVDECKKKCSADEKCLGFDFDTNTKYCWIGTDKAKFEASSEAKGVTQYTRKKTCPGDCKDAFKKIADTNVNGATKSDGVSTVDACKTACFADSKCKGFIFNNDDTTCWIIQDEEKLKAQTKQARLDLYERLPCASSCIDAFKMTADTNVFGASKSDGVTTANACKTACLADSSCKALIFNKDDKSCWLIDDEEKLKSKTTRSQLDLYERLPCDPRVTGVTTGGTGVTQGPCQKYKEEKGTQYFGAADKPADTADACKKLCDDDANCVAVGYIPSKKQCWIHTKASDLTGNKNTGVADYDSYVKQKDCVGVTGTATGGPCTVQFEKLANKQYFGADPVGTANTEAKCRQACLDNKDCVAFGFDRTTGISDTQRCWIHKDAAQLSGSVSDNTNYDSFKRGKDCPSPGTGPGVCEVAYTKEENKQYFGADIKRTLTTLDACKKNCNENKECVGFGFNRNTNPNECWIHIKASDFSGSQATFDQYDSYKKDSNSCATKAPCTVTYDKVDRTHSFEGTKIANANTLEACKKVCTDTKDCGAFDFNGNECWWHKDDAWKNRLNPNQDNIAQYRKKPCDTGTDPTKPPGYASPVICVDKFNENKGKYGRGGSRDTTANKIEDCSKLCLARKDCVGFDFNTDGNSCWIHTDATVFNNLQSDSQNVITNYQRIPCEKPTPTGQPTGCKIEYKEFPGKNAFNGVRITSANGEAACKDYCTKQTTCFGIDVVTSSGFCFVFNDKDAAEKINNAPGVNHFIINRCAVVTGQSPKPTGSPTCTVTFDTVKDTLSYNGQEKSTLQSIKACQDECEKDKACVAFDWDKNNNKCYLHVTASALEDSNRLLGKAGGVDQYIKKPCEKPNQKCTDTFDKLDRTHAYDGTLMKTADTIAKCTDVCLADAKCLAFDFNGGCYVHTKAENLVNVNTNADNVAHYRRKKNDACVTPSPTGECKLTTDYNAPVINNGMIGYSDPSVTRKNSAAGKTPAECKTICNADAECRAIMFFKPSGICVSFANVSATQSFDGFDTYLRKEECKGVTKPPECPVEYVRVEGTGYHRGVGKPLGIDFNTCLDICKKDQACTGADYNPNNTPTSRCFTHTIPFIDANKYSASGVSHVTITKRECGPKPPSPDGCKMVLKPLRRQNSGFLLTEGITALPKLFNAQQCADECLKTTLCRSADHNTAFKMCYLHFSEGVVTSNSDINHYAKESCTECRDSFVWYQSKRAVIAQNPVQISQTRTLAQCARLCLTTPTCDAFQFYTMLLQCYHFQGSGVIAMSQTASQDNVDLYVRSRCGVQPIPTQPPTTRAPVPPTVGPVVGTCSKNTAASGGPFVSLMDYLLVSVPGSNNGQLMTGITTAAACETNCLTRTSCFGYLFLPGSARPCTTFTSKEIALEKVSQSIPGLVAKIANCQAVGK